MKQTLLIISLLAAYFSFGQNSLAQSDSFKTEIEQAVNAKDVLIKKEFVDLDQIKRVRFRFLKVYNFETKTTTKGLYIFPKSGRYKKTHYLDSAEIIAIYNSLLRIDSISRIFPKVETEFVTLSKDNFKVGVKSDDWTGNRDRRMYLNKRKLYKKGISLNEKKFKHLIAVFANAKGLL